MHCRYVIIGVSNAGELWFDTSTDLLTVKFRHSSRYLVCADLWTEHLSNLVCIHAGCKYVRVLSFVRISGVTLVIGARGILQFCHPQKFRCLMPLITPIFTVSSLSPPGAVLPLATPLVQIGFKVSSDRVIGDQFLS